MVFCLYKRPASLSTDMLVYLSIFYLFESCPSSNSLISYSNKHKNLLKFRNNYQRFESQESKSQQNDDSIKILECRNIAISRCLERNLSRNKNSNNRGMSGSDNCSSLYACEGSERDPQIEASHLKPLVSKYRLSFDFIVTSQHL